MRRFVGVLLACGLLVGCGGGSKDSKIAFDSGKIAFMKLRGGTGCEIFVMNADGTGVSQLTDHYDRDLLTNDCDKWPVWSPNGKQIAFVREIGSRGERDGSWIFVMNADGTGVSQLTDHNDRDWSPTWSPDGKRIAFASDRDGDFEIFAMNADGTGVSQLTDNNDQDRSPVWSPNSNQIAFMSGQPGAGDGIFVMNADGSGVTQLTDDWNSYSDSDPSWSSDGNKIAFGRNRFDDGDYSIFVMNADGTGVTQLTNNNDDDDRWPVWSPNGTQIAFARNRGWEIFVMNADGSDVVSLGQRGWPRSWG